MIVFPAAKINLGLHVLDKRQDGYHNIETLLYPIGWCDALEIVPAKEHAKTDFYFRSEGIDLNVDITDNLCFKAYSLLKNDFPLPGVECYLQKNIPHGAGLGGGSSDALAALQLINSVFELNLSNDKLANYAVKLGSDCPFFIYKVPMLATGRGDVLRSYSLTLSGIYLTVVMPQFMVSTREAYSTVVPGKPDVPLESALMLRMEEWKYALVNDFEKSVFEKYPALREIKSQLYILGADYASMSGSGSAIYSLSRRKPDTSGFSGCTVWTERLP